VQLRRTHRQVILHDARIHLLLRDRIPANRQPVPLLQNQTRRLGRGQRFELCQRGLIRPRLQGLGKSRCTDQKTRQEKKFWAYHVEARIVPTPPPAVKPARNSKPQSPNLRQSSTSSSLVGMFVLQPPVWIVTEVV